MAFNCSSVSTPSATTVSPRLFDGEIIAATIDASRSLFGNSLKNDRSIQHCSDKKLTNESGDIGTPRRSALGWSVGYEATLDQLLPAVATGVTTTNAGTLILGGLWRPVMRDPMGSLPKQLLDQISPAHPVALQDVTQHSIYVQFSSVRDGGTYR